ncbi:hypothetical protein DFAR_2310016 [Desulfarculales bacterium]
MLLGVAWVLKRAVREDDMAYRYGGEEFAVILPGTSLETAMQATERIRRGVEQLALWLRARSTRCESPSAWAWPSSKPAKMSKTSFNAPTCPFTQATDQSKNRCVRAPGAPGGA